MQRLYYKRCRPSISYPLEKRKMLTKNFIEKKNLLILMFLFTNCNQYNLIKLQMAIKWRNCVVSVVEILFMAQTALLFNWNLNYSCYFGENSSVRFTLNLLASFAGACKMQYYENDPFHNGTDRQVIKSICVSMTNQQILSTLLRISQQTPFRMGIQWKLNWIFWV